MTGFLTDKVKYRSYLMDHAEEADYEDYTLTNVMVREVFAVDPDMTEDGTTTVYFFTGLSTCTDASGNACRMPYPKYGDVVVLGNYRTLRVAEAGYFTADGDLGHVRLK
ncbi:MAG: hypothetical protein IJ037_07075, partial [Clostridia bacterium]|nr:hypothetical protein [Clostridia bacterium]